VTAALAQAYCAGIDVASEALAPLAARVDLPTYAFQRRRYWLTPVGAPDVRLSGLDDPGHPLLGAMVRVPGSQDVVFTGRWLSSDHAWLADHAVTGVVLLPGAALVELVLHVGTLVACSRVAELVIEAPFRVPFAGAVDLMVVANGPDAGGVRTVSVYSRRNGHDPEAWVCHATAQITAEPDPASVGAEPAIWPPRDAIAVSIDGAYTDLAEAGYDYGPAFRGLTALWRRGAEVFAEIVLPDSVRPQAAQFGLHPALLDAALHTILLGGLSPDVPDGAVAVPFLWENVVLSATGATALRVRAAMTGSGPGGERIAVTLTDPAGMPVAEVGALTMRPLPVDTLGAEHRRNDGGYGLDWVALSAATGETAARWRLADDEETVTVAKREATVVRLYWESDARDLPMAVRDSLTALTVRIQRLLTGDRLVVVVTRRATAVHAGESMDLAAASAWGLLRTVQREHPGRILVVDVDEWADYRTGAASAVAMAGEPQLAVRYETAYAPRLRSTPPALSGLEAMRDTPAWAFAPLGEGTLSADNFAVADDPRGAAPLAAGQVRVSMRSVGLNFRDVLIALGTYPIEGAQIGSEGAGVVLEVAPDVTEFLPGDRVFGFATGAGSVAVTDRRLLAPIPRGWSFADAAAVPVVYATAYHGLVDLAAARPGQTLLLHAATGGVGMAAVQLARHLGLRLLVTASERKWNILRAMGFADSEIGDSRTSDFERKFLDSTGGRGADIVLDSLAAEFVDASLRLLPRGGRFIEMGLLDRRDPAEVAAAHPGVDYRSFVLLDVDPDRLGKILATLVELFDTGALTPARTTAWDLRQAPEVFRYISQARHLGKNVLTVPAPLRPGGTVLLTGGTGVLGALAARHLVAKYGVRRLLLAGRRGPDAPGAAELCAELTALGAHTEVVACDVADRAALEAVLAAIPPDHPLTGVVHAAGVLADGLFATMTPGQIAEVLRPKVDAAWNLHEATAHLDLSMFVLYSSIAGVIGTAGQANYAAANAFLDALAQHRHVSGLPATSIAWGLWQQSTGMTGELDAIDIARLRREGLLALQDEDGMALFDAGLAAGQAAFVAARIDRTALAEAPPDEVSAVLRGLSRPARRRAADEQDETSDLTAQLAGRSVAEQERLLLDVIRVQAAAVLGHDSADSIALDKPFSDSGFDSLGVMEFRNRMKSAAGVKLPPTAMFDYPTPAALVGYLRQEIAPIEESTERIAAEVDSLARSCAAAQLSPADRSDIVGRLTALLRDLAGDDPAAIDQGGVDSIDTADDGELFAFIDHLG